MHIDKITIATTNTDAMIAFYNALFDANLTAIPDSPLYRGTLNAMTLIFCPNTIVGINAEKNRIQLRFVVDDIDAVVNQAQAHGGGAYGDRVDDDAQIGWGIHDPDGNSIELMQPKA